MVRKNSSKETIKKIITVATKLFIGQGYEKTSIQDIVEASGMSKGAIFHHFKSKEDIFDEVMEVQGESTTQLINEWISELNGLTAKEKLIEILKKNMFNEQVHSLDDVLAPRIQSPYFVISNMKDSVNKSAPIFSKIMYEGKEDGSITTDFPDECAEIFFLLLNIWCDPMIFEANREKLSKRLKFLQQTMKNMGADIVSDELIDNYLKFIEKLYVRSNIWKEN